MCIIVIYAIVRHRVSCKFHIHNSMSSCMRLDYVAVWQFIFAIRLWHGLIYIVGILCPPGAIDHSRTYVGIKIYVGGNEVYVSKATLAPGTRQTMVTCRLQCFLWAQSTSYYSKQFRGSRNTIKSCFFSNDLIYSNHKPVLNRCFINDLGSIPLHQHA